MVCRHKFTLIFAFACNKMILKSLRGLSLFQNLLTASETLTSLLRGYLPSLLGTKVIRA